MHDAKKYDELQHKVKKRVYNLYARMEKFSKETREDFRQILLDMERMACEATDDNDKGR